jgi:hemerythrin-like domain-containing protein
MGGEGRKEASMERASDVLMSEHRNIERVLRVLEVAAVKVESGQELPADVFRKAVDFVRGYADGCHHSKEEQTLFPLLEERGVPRQGPIGVMLNEHELGRQYVAAIADAIDGYERGDAESAQAIAENARNYAGLLRLHIMKEDNVLFRMSDQALSDEDQKRLLARFEEIDHEEGDARERYEGMIDALEREVGIAGGG